MTTPVALIASESTGQVLSVATALFMIGCVFAFARVGSMHSLWSMLNSLQLIVHFPLNNVPFPENVLTVFEQMKQLVNFDFVRVFSGGWPDLSAAGSLLGSFNSNFDRIGYTSGNAIDNMGSATLILAVIYAMLPLLLVMRCFCP